MKISYLRSLFFICFLIGFSVVGVSAQNAQPNPKNTKNNFRQGKLLQSLGLSKEQIQQIRRINGEKRIQINEAQMRLRQANRNLDQAIYADNVNEAEIQNRLKEVQNAHAEVIRIRALTELEVRKILTAEQLNKFLQMRRQVLERMNNGDNPSVSPPDEMQNPPSFNKRRFQRRQNN